MTTLMRLSIWVPAEHQSAFAGAYEQHLAPILKQHGLVATAEDGRPTVEGVFSRLFVVDAPATLVEHEHRLQQDATWQQALQLLAPDFSEEGVNDGLSYHFGSYQTPAGPGRTVYAGQGFRQGMWHSLGLADGMHFGVYAVLQDRAGHLWTGSAWNGISRYDGSHLTTFTASDGLASRRVQCLLEDREGALWVGTVQGLSRYDGHLFETFTRADGLAHDYVSCLLEDRAGRLWVGSARGGVSRRDRAGWTTYTQASGLADDYVTALLEDRQGQLWIATYGGGVSRYNGADFVPYPHADGSGSNQVLALAEDDQGRLWVGTEVGASYFVADRFVAVDELRAESIRAMVADDRGHLWFATGLNGVYRFDGTEWRHFTSVDGLASDQVHSLTTDRQGQLWAGTLNGLSRYDQTTFAHFTTADGLVHNGVQSILEDRQGQLWFGTMDGVSRYDGITFTNPKPLAGWRVWSMVEDRQGNVWFGDTRMEKGQGILRYDGTQFTRFTREDGLADDSARSLLEDQQGHLWVGSNTEGGVSRFDGTGWPSFTQVGGLAEHSVEAMLEDRHGQLWFALDSGGVSRYDGEEWVHFTPADGLAHRCVKSFLEDHQGRLWLSTFGGGVSCFDGQSFVNFTTQDGLAYDLVRPILEDRRGHLWFGTFGGGVSCFDGLVFQSLSRQDGLIFDAVTALLEDRHGNIWIGTEGGITRYRPSSIPPQIQLKAIIADQRYPTTSPIAISASQKLVAFEFEGSSWTTPPERLAYVYQLEGYDADWCSVYTNRVEYQDLPVGDYTFQVQAVDRDLNRSDPDAVRVNIEPDALVESLNATLRQSSAQGEFVGTSPALHTVQQQLRQVAPADLTVLILGETGTGKGLAARTLHNLSPRRDHPFILFTGGATPDQLIEAELFGHEKGAFTGAVDRRLGKVELAQGGTLFLDEIGDLPPVAQIKLLRLLEERTFERVGGTQVFEADVRIVAATNRDLHQMIEAATFREDLYYRLQGQELELPPLRARREDIPLLALYFIGPKAAHLDKEVNGLTKAAEAALVAHAWPGNVRELQHAIERAVVSCQGPIIEVDDLSLGRTPNTEPAPSERVTLEEYERRYIQAVLEDTDGRVSGPKGAARILGLKDSTLRSRMRKLGIRPS